MLFFIPENQPKGSYCRLLAYMTVLAIQECISGQQHKSVIEVLLVIGGVESNPGPQTVAEILGILIVEAPSENIKKTLNIVRTDVEHKDNLKNLLKAEKDSSSVDELKATCIFLHESSGGAFGDYLKDSLAETNLYRINQLYPENCQSHSD